MAYCARCGYNHRNDCPKERKERLALSECPQCNEPKKIAKDDYVCASCRLEMEPKYTVSIPEIALNKLRNEDVNALTSMLLKHGVGFSVVPE